MPAPAGIRRGAAGRIRRRKYGNERNFYERETGTASAGLHGGSHGDLHAGELSVQHRGQLLRGADQRGCHVGSVSGVSGAESYQCPGHRLRHRHQRGHCLLPGGRGPGPGGPGGFPGNAAFHPPRGGDHDRQHLCHALLSGDVYPQCLYCGAGGTVFQYRLFFFRGDHDQPDF